MATVAPKSRSPRGLYPGAGRRDPRPDCPQATVEVDSAGDRILYAAYLFEFIPAPTDFRITERVPAPWYQELKALVPTPSNLVLFSDAMHEYLGIFYYQLRGWM